ncbi:GntR family transcriptional regulator [candidate division KSB1 bacterium]|nr:GntR family transcriptional regulator [candidate division KSB1 bacterium]
MINFKLDPKSGVPFYRQIIDQIRYGIAAGNLQVGEQLPTVRALAVELKVNLNTVSKAYKELEIKELLETQQGTGTFISSKPIDLSEAEKQQKLTSICKEFTSVASTYGFTVQDIIESLKSNQRSLS